MWTNFTVIVLKQKLVKISNHIQFKINMSRNAQISNMYSKLWLLKQRTSQTWKSYFKNHIQRENLNMHHKMNKRLLYSVI